jgi:hypothetical protein
MPDKLKDHLGNEREVDTDRLPDGAPAKEGKASPPSGQGGATPHDGVAYQDQWPANPPPSESAAAKGKENDELLGHTNNPTVANEKTAKAKK